MALSSQVEEVHGVGAAGRPAPRPRLGSARRAFDAVWTWIRHHYLAVGITAVLLIVVGIPILSVITFSFREGSPVNPGAATLQNYKDAYLNPQTLPALMNTVVYAVIVSAFSLAIAVFFAWLIERTDLPGRNLAWTLMLLPIAMPGMLSAMAWILLLSERIGLINIAVRNVLSVFGVHLVSGPFDIYSLPGMIFLESVRGSSTLFLMMVAAFRLMDPSMEEAASIAGIRPRRMFFKVTLPLIFPALLAAGTYALIGNLDDLEVPLLLGVPAGIFLLPTLIWFTGAQKADWGLSSAYTTIFLIITILMVVIYYRWVLRRASAFVTVTGKGYRPRRIPLGKWKYPAVGVFITYFVFTIVAPLSILLWASILPVYEVPSAEAWGKITLDNYRELFNTPQIINSAVNTLEIAGWTALATMVLAFLVSWLVVRQRVKGGVALDAISFIPHAIPSVAIGVALISFYLNPAVRWAHIYGTIVIMILALMTRFLAFGTRTANSAMSALGAELEEAAYVSGVGRVRVLTRITFRLLSPAFIAGLIWIGAHALKNLSVPLMLATPRTNTIATTLYFYWQRKADFSLASALGIALVVVLGILAFAGRKLIARGFSGQE